MILKAASFTDCFIPVSYSAYGDAKYAGMYHALAYTGERFDRHTDCYLLGNGYRAYNPKLMRFVCPDDWSPFGKGGINSYAFCSGDPVNHRDPSGHAPLPKIAKVPKITKAQALLYRRSTLSEMKVLASGAAGDSVKLYSAIRALKLYDKAVLDRGEISSRGMLPEHKALLEEKVGEVNKWREKFGETMFATNNSFFHERAYWSLFYNSLNNVTDLRLRELMKGVGLVKFLDKFKLTAPPALPGATLYLGDTVQGFRTS